MSLWISFSFLVALSRREIPQTYLHFILNAAYLVSLQSFLNLHLNPNLLTAGFMLWKTPQKERVKRLSLASFSYVYIWNLFTRLVYNFIASIFFDANILLSCFKCYRMLLHLKPSRLRECIRAGVHGLVREGFSLFSKFWFFRRSLSGGGALKWDASVRKYMCLNVFIGDSCASDKCVLFCI